MWRSFGVAAIAWLLAVAEALWPLNCDVRRVAKNTSALETLLASGESDSPCGHRPILGQHVALSLVPYVVSGHLNERTPEKPLVMLFVGPTGVGKSMMADRLANGMFKPRLEQWNSIETRLKMSWNPSIVLGAPNTLIFSGVDFRDRSAEELGAKMSRQIRDQVHACSKSLIVLDEVQFFPRYTLDHLLDILDFKQPVPDEKHGMVDFRRATFIMTSNFGSDDITDVFEDLRAEGRPRSAIGYEEFVEVLEDALYTKEPFLVDKNRIDYFVPFLPMEKEQLSTAIEWSLKNVIRCKGVRERKFATLEWDAGTVEWLSRTEGPSAYNVTIYGLARVSTTVTSGVGAAIDRAVRRRKIPQHSPQSVKRVRVTSDGRTKPVVTVDVIPAQPPKRSAKGQGDKNQDDL